MGCKIINNNKYNIPIPSAFPSNSTSPAANIVTSPAANITSLRLRTIGIGETIIDTNYYWLRDNKDVINREINKTSDHMKTLLSDLLYKEINLLKYCKLLKKLLKYLIKYPNFNIWKVFIHRKKNN